MPTSNKKPNWLAWALKFIGSLVYLYVVYQLWTYPVSGSVFAPVLFGLAVVLSVALFLANLATLAAPKGDLKMWVSKTVTWGGFALIAATYTMGSMVGPATATALIGFIIAYIGSGMDMS